MAEPSPHPDFDLDTAVSADLDGELDAYAADLGVEPDALRRVLAEPEGVARRADLFAVRQALGKEPEPSLDDVTRRRLLDGAGVGARSRPPRDRGRLLRAGVAAAITLVVMGALYAITRDSGGSGSSGDSAAKSAAGGSTAAAVTGDVGDLGTVDPQTIARLLRGERVPPKAAEGSAAADANGSAKSGFATRAPSSRAITVSPDAVAACATRYSTAGSIRFRGSGTFGGRGSAVLGIDTGRRTIVFVVAADDCAQVLYSASR